MAGIFDSAPPWELRVAGFTVQTIEFHGCLLTVVAYGAGRDRLRLTLSGPFRLRAGGAELELNAEKDWQPLAPILSLRGDQITEASVSADSALRVQFASGKQIEAADDGSRFETWELSGPGFKVVGTPGNPAIWTGDGERRST